MTERVRKGLLEAADTLARIAEDLRNGDEISRGVLSSREYIERITALRTAISVIRAEANK